MKSKIFLSLVVLIFVLTIVVIIPSFVEKKPPTLQASNEDSVVVLADSEPLTDKINHI